MPKNITLRWKLLVASFASLIAVISLITIATVVTLRHNAAQEIASLRQAEIDKSKAELKQLVDVAYSIVNATYENTHDP
ncbi:MAG TPA: hypothetical protein VLL73_03935, partial [Desulfurivibrionaceae bacterium]|nr:hypothetical protein [Desulfurivibrionaceae bacterium]